MLVSTLISMLWVAMAVASLLVKLFPSLSFFYVHGKGVDTSHGDHTTTDQPRIFSWIARAYVPKSNFSHMYVIGMLVGGVLPLLLSTRPTSREDRFTFHANSTTAWLSIVLFELQVSRRLWECLVITEFGSSKVHLFAYLVGCFHYILAPLTLSLSFFEDPNESYHFLIGTNTKHLLTVAVFLLANYFQYQHHRILFDLKLRTLKEGKGYSIPQKMGFEFVCCPHYSLEILIYLAFSFLHFPSLPCLAMNLWVVTNLCIVADSNYHFYFKCDRLGANGQQTRTVNNWKRIIPLSW